MRRSTAIVLFLSLVLVARSAAADGGVFLGGRLGASLLQEEGHAPPLCCSEREDWDAAGGRAAGRVGYSFAFAPLIAFLDAGAAVHRVTGRAGLDLTLVSTELALNLGKRYTSAARRVEIAGGVGLTRFSGTAHELAGTDRRESHIATSAPDLRFSIAIYGRVRPTSWWGGEFSFTKVLIEQHLITFSAVYTWDG